MRRIVVALAAGLFLGTISSAQAVITDPLNASWSTSDTSSNPSISPSSFSTGLFDNVPVSATQSAFNLFTVSPGGSCAGPGCVGGPNGTETDTITFTMQNMSVTINSQVYNLSNFSDTATFTAKYSGSELGCAVGDGSSPAYGQTDCLVWSGGGNNGNYNGVSTFTQSIGNGQTLTIALDNATDWSVTPTMTMEITGTPTGGGGQGVVPEPASLALFGVGLAGLGLIRRRRNAAR